MTPQIRLLITDSIRHSQLTDLIYVFRQEKFDLKDFPYFI